MCAEAGHEPSCFGAFQPEGRCLDCAATLWCQDFTIRLDMEAMAQLEGQEWYTDALEQLIECVEGGASGRIVEPDKVLP